MAPGSGSATVPGLSWLVPILQGVQGWAREGSRGRSASACGGAEVSARGEDPGPGVSPRRAAKIGQGSRLRLRRQEDAGRSEGGHIPAPSARRSGGGPCPATREPGVGLRQGGGEGGGGCWRGGSGVPARLWSSEQFAESPGYAPMPLEVERMPRGRALVGIKDPRDRLGRRLHAWRTRQLVGSDAVEGGGGGGGGRRGRGGGSGAGGEAGGPSRFDPHLYRVWDGPDDRVRRVPACAAPGDCPELLGPGQRGLGGLGACLRAQPLRPGLEGRNRCRRFPLLPLPHPPESPCRRGHRSQRHSCARGGRAVRIARGDVRVVPWLLFAVASRFRRWARGGAECGSRRAGGGGGCRADALLAVPGGALRGESGQCGQPLAPECGRDHRQLANGRGGSRGRRGQGIRGQRLRPPAGDRRGLRRLAGATARATTEALEAELAPAGTPRHTDSGWRCVVVGAWALGAILLRLPVGLSALLAGGRAASAVPRRRRTRHPARGPVGGRPDGERNEHPRFTRGAYRRPRALQRPSRATCDSGHRQRRRWPSSPA